jgi:hypothetical protein
MGRARRTRAQSKASLSFYRGPAGALERRLLEAFMRPLSRPSLAIALFFLASAAAAQEVDANAGRASTIGEAIGRLFEGVNLRKSPPPAADFVVRSRPAELDYAPLAPAGAAQQVRAKKKSPRDVEKLESELRAAAAANRARAARARTPDGPTRAGP